MVEEYMDPHITCDFGFTVQLLEAS
jgi:hypothetical protein